MGKLGDSKMRKNITISVPEKILEELETHKKETDAPISREKQGAISML